MDVKTEYKLCAILRVPPRTSLWEVFTCRGDIVPKVRFLRDLLEDNLRSYASRAEDGEYILSIRPSLTSFGFAVLLSSQELDDDSHDRSGYYIRLEVLCKNGRIRLPDSDLGLDMAVLVDTMVERVHQYEHDTATRL
jgi:hypothetical protein